ncbi:YceI family protein [Gelidibacter japonicus]|uniref:YceI family protein n=1 Tax=Gelidibacter japonicus TaxID=1962232 RepID=UPI0013D1F39D|nr:YceI family protein [Gelidibacter japonicus]MCL8009347.1 YceI family protein [Gelidibacter japonicus]
MNRLYYFLLPLLALSCIGKHKSDAPKVIINPTVEHSVEIEADTLIMNLEKSKIEWVATEMGGTKRRTGIISFKNGLFLGKEGEIVGGNFTVDMETMDVTDVPTHEKVARKNLLDHLKGNDFFNVSHYPISTLELTKVQKTKNDSLKITGNLTIREVTKNIDFFAYHKNGAFRTTFTFNRLDWNIAYEGSWADKTLVDKDVELTIEITTE